MKPTEQRDRCTGVQVWDRLSKSFTQETYFVALKSHVGIKTRSLIHTFFFSRVVCAGGKVGNPICPTPRLTVPKDATSKAPSHGTEVADFFLLSACEALE